MVLACCTAAQPGMEVVTDDPALRSERLERLAELLARHPHICLSCPDRDGCTRQECTYGIAAKRAVATSSDGVSSASWWPTSTPAKSVPRRAVAVSRDGERRGPDPAGARSLPRVRAVRRASATLRRPPARRCGWCGSSRRRRSSRRRAPPARRAGRSRRPEEGHPPRLGLHVLRAVRHGVPRGSDDGAWRGGGAVARRPAGEDRSPRARAAARVPGEPLADGRLGARCPAVPGVFLLADDARTGAPHRRGRRPVARHRARAGRAGLRRRHLLPDRAGSALHSAGERASCPLRAARGTPASRERSRRRPLRRRLFADDLE